MPCGDSRCGRPCGGAAVSWEVLFGEAEVERPSRKAYVGTAAPGCPWAAGPMPLVMRASRCLLHRARFAVEERPFEGRVKRIESARALAPEGVALRETLARRQGPIERLLRNLRPGHWAPRTPSTASPNSTSPTPPQQAMGIRADAPASTPARDGAPRAQACSTAFPRPPAKAEPNRL